MQDPTQDSAPGSNLVQSNRRTARFILLFSVKLKGQLGVPSQQIAMHPPVLSEMHRIQHFDVLQVVIQSRTRPTMLHVRGSA